MCSFALSLPPFCEIQFKRTYESEQVKPFEISKRQVSAVVAEEPVSVFANLTTNGNLLVNNLNRADCGVCTGRGPESY
jgi:hypothetical protein